MGPKAVVALLCAVFAAVPASARAIDTATLRAKLTKEQAALGTFAAAYVRDLSTGRTLYLRKADKALIPASNNKMLTTLTALIKLGPDAALRTTLYAPGPAVDGVIGGDVVLSGGGDPYLTAQGLDLIASQVAALGVTHIAGRVLADASMLDDRPGSPWTGFAFDPVELGARLSALQVDRYRGADPALRAARLLHAALKAHGITLDAAPRAGAVPQGAVELAGADSAPIRSIAAAINVPSDNYGAELLLKDLGACFGGAGTTTAGAAVVRATLATLGIHPRIVDGSGLSREDRLTPRQIVRLLELMLAQPSGAAFAASLPVAGRTGTLEKRMRTTRARDNCRAKTGTLSDVSALSGYCTAANGSTIAFSFMENHVNTNYAKAAEDRMVSAIARYTG